MISWPGKVKPRMDKDHLAINVDLWPTLAGLLKTPLPPGLSGINLTDERAVAKRQRLFGEQYAHNIADVDAPTRSLQNRWIIDGWWKLVAPDSRHRTDGQAELYDLSKDPWEKDDLARKETGRVKQLRQQLDAWWNPGASESGAK